MGSWRERNQEHGGYGDQNPNQTKHQNLESGESTSPQLRQINATRNLEVLPGFELAPRRRRRRRRLRRPSRELSLEWDWAKSENCGRLRALYMARKSRRLTWAGSRLLFYNVLFLFSPVFRWKHIIARQKNVRNQNYYFLKCLPIYKIMNSIFSRFFKIIDKL